MVWWKFWRRLGLGRPRDRTAFPRVYCARVGRSVKVPQGSETRRCNHCQHEVTIDPGTLALEASTPVDLICLSCANDLYPDDMLARTWVLGVLKDWTVRDQYEYEQTLFGDDTGVRGA